MAAPSGAWRARARATLLGLAVALAGCALSPFGGPAIQSQSSQGSQSIQGSQSGQGSWSSQVGAAVGGPPPPAPVALGELRSQSQRAAQEALRGSGGLAASRPVAIAAVLARDEEPAGDDNAFALVLTERGPRAESLCGAMLERMDLFDIQPGSRARFTRRPVYWMLSATAVELDALRDISCAELTARLDVQRAQAVGLGAETGPVLAAEARRDGNVWTMRWDLSDLPPSEFPRAVRIWNELLAGDPAGWETRAAAVRWRESARAFLIRYGEPLDGVFGPRAARAEVGRPAPRHVIIR